MGVEVEWFRCWLRGVEVCWLLEKKEDVCAYCVEVGWAVYTCHIDNRVNKYSTKRFS
jgi:hypothetical protein